ncbi:MAG: type III-A CRISPR-associated protein Csm2 [Methylomonas sp.]|nr:type III-A CRISPR-associated protein Csm2 [Methylomonas sp.]
MALQPQQRHGHASRGGYDERRVDPIDTSNINLKNIAADLFDGVARTAAETIAASKKELNKPTQLRRFYDEIVLWDNKANLQPERFAEFLPFIRMINAKVAYASGRKLVDDNFVKLINHGIGQIDSADTLRYFKLFMEAFMGFYKEKRPKD